MLQRLNVYKTPWSHCTFFGDCPNLVHFPVTNKEEITLLATIPSFDHHKGNRIEATVWLWQHILLNNVFSKDTRSLTPPKLRFYYITITDLSISLLRSKQLFPTNTFIHLTKRSWVCFPFCQQTTKASCHVGWSKGLPELCCGLCNVRLRANKAGETVYPPSQCPW